MVRNAESYCSLGRTKAKRDGAAALVSMVLLWDVPEEARYLGKILIWPGRASSGKDLPETFSHVGSGSPETDSHSRRHIVGRGRLTTFSLVRRDFTRGFGSDKFREGIGISWHPFSRWLGTHIRESLAQNMCRMTPSRNLGHVIAIKRECLTIIALTVANVVIRGFREICIARREVASIFDKRCLSNDHVAPVGTKGVGMMELQVALLGNLVRFEDIGDLVQFLPLILGSVLG